MPDSRFVFAAALIPLLFAAAPAPVPVNLAPRPGTPLDAAARALVADDLADAGRNNDKPLVLIGTAQLGTASTRQALFIQLQSSRECGSAGCNTSVYLWRDGKYQRVLDGIGGNLSISPTKHLGMADLLAEGERYVWSGQEYRDSRPAPSVDLRPHHPTISSGRRARHPTSAPAHTAPAPPA